MKEFFIPPDFNLATAWFADATLPFALKTYQNIEEIVISPEDSTLLRSLKNERLIFFTNHPSQAEPMIAWHIANMMGSRFRYMATRRAFDFVFGAVGKLFQGTGAYSVLPGVPDRDSMRMTRQILAAPSGKLAIFPEGEPMCGENDSLMPFQPGFLKLGFGALADARKIDPKADILILPGFMKYVIKSPREEIISHLETSIHEIEKKLGLEPGERNLLRQFLMVGRVLLEQTEREYGIEPDNTADFDFRIGRVRHQILDNVARSMDIKNYNKDADAIHKLRHLTSIIELLEVGYPGPDLPKLSAAELAKVNRECIKAYDFIVIKRDYLISRPTPERFYEWLQRFQSLALGKTPRALGGEPHPLPRRAHITFAPPVRMGDYYQDYQKNKGELVLRLTDSIRGDMQKLLDASTSLTYTIVEPGNVGGT
ncbi:MAG: 1-acyl-sn-glycerol-3-phosphate acyltransferase [Spirochaetia bacterium]|nr:1-acyl-sn-glycerol-3-phosphate acyltransferase [Spirochaetia bacterium]